LLVDDLALLGREVDVFYASFVVDHVEVLMGGDGDGIDYSEIGGAFDHYGF